MASLPTESPPATAPQPPTEELDEIRATLDALRDRLAAPQGSAACAELYVRCTDLLRMVEARLRELDPDAETATDRLVSMCTLLGPYRNLTTLTASVLALHPQCAVLNHAGGRILTNRRLNFLSGYTEEKFADFVRYALLAARGGERGMHGGDIRLSHAFDREAMRRADASVKRSPERTAKCLVWKESQLVTNFLREERIDVVALLEANPRLRFMLPVRNPIECAVSNVRRGHVRALGGGRGLSRSSPIRDVVAAVLDEIRWFVELREASGRPERFMLFFEHEMGRGVLEQMLRFLALDMDEAFLAAAAEAFTSERAPARNPGLVARYVQLVQERFSDRTEIRDALLRFVPA